MALTEPLADFRITTAESFSALSKALKTSFVSEYKNLTLNRWKPSELCAAFDVDWEGSQLKAIVKDLALEDVEAVGIAGGSLVRTLLKDDVFKGDIDIFASNDEALDKLIAVFKKNKSWEKTKFSYTFEYQFGVRKTKVQIITKDAPRSALITLNRFDFEHCKFLLAPGNKLIYCSQTAPIALAKRQIRLGYISDPIYSLARVMKYKRLGFDADKAIEQLTVMAMKGIKDVYFTLENKGAPLASTLDDLVDVVISEASS